MSSTRQPRGQKRRRALLVLALVAASWGAVAVSPASDPAVLRTVAALTDASATPGGIGVVLGARPAELASALAKQGTFHVQALCTEPGLCDTVRAAIREHGNYGAVCARPRGDGPLPYADNLVNLVLLDPAAAADSCSGAELYRVLAPLGAAFVLIQADAAASTPTGALVADFLAAGGRELPTVESGEQRWRYLTKPWPAELDDWTHFLHGADGNPVALDRRVGPPARCQWVSDPIWLRSHDTDSSISTLVTARGRLFAIVDEGPISLVGQHGLPDRWSLIARDAFNGTLLWRVPIRRWGWREWKQTWFNTRPGDIPLNLQKRLVATADRVYATLGYEAPVSELDARTGEIRRSYAGTEGTREILWRAGILYLSVPDGARVRISAIDAQTGQTLWTSAYAYRGSTVDYIKWSEGLGAPPVAPLAPSLNSATDGQIVALLDGPDIVALDAQSGAERWRSPFPADPADRHAGGMRTDGTLWIGTLIVTGDTVVHASPNCLAAFDARDGRLLWKQPKKYIGHLWYEWKDVFVIDGRVWTWSAELEAGSIGAPGSKAQRELWPTAANAYDLRSGTLQHQVPLGATFKANHHHRCYRNKATSRYLLASRRGTECIDLEGGVHSVDNWVRGTCHLGMMPANGLLYAPPHPCACYIDEKLNGFLALGPETVPVTPLPTTERTWHGPGFSQPLPSFPTIDPAVDWPEFRHDGARTGAVQTALSDAARPLWRVSLGGQLSAPVAAAGRVFLARVEAHQVLCLDAADGKVLWHHTTGGRVDSPPTLAEGRLLFGSADGAVTCLSAADGQLLWRFLAAPADRQVAVRDQLESAWPVHGSVLLRQGTAYLVAGRSSHLDGGLFLYGLDAATGAVRCQTRLDGPQYTSQSVEQNFQLPMGTLPDILLSDGDAIAMRTTLFDAQLRPHPGRPPLQTRAGFLDDSYFKRTPWTMNGESARLIAHDNQAVYYVRMFDSLRSLDPTVFFTPGSQGYLLFAKNMKGDKKTWSVRLPIRVRAMVLTPDRLLVAGPPDSVPLTDPLGAFEGRQGGILASLDAASGERRAEHRLPSPPVFNGTAASRGRLFLAAEDGSVSCFGAP